MVTPLEEHSHKKETAIISCVIKGAGKLLLVKWTDKQVTLNTGLNSNLLCDYNQFEPLNIKSLRCTGCQLVLF